MSLQFQLEKKQQAEIHSACISLGLFKENQPSGCCDYNIPTNSWSFLLVKVDMNPSKFQNIEMRSALKTDKHAYIPPGALASRRGKSLRALGSVRDKFISDDMNDKKEHVLQHMRRLWNNWRGSLHKNIKSKPFRDALKDVPRGVEKSDWEWLVKEHFLSEKFKETSTRNSINRSKLRMPHRTGSKPFREVVYEMAVEKCFGPQRKSHVVGFGGGITAKELKGGNSSKAALLDKLNASEKENESLKRRMDELENKCERLDELESKYERLASAVFGQHSSPPSSSDQ